MKTLYHSIAGRFFKVPLKRKDIIVIAFIGTASAKTLTEDEKHYIMNFYGIKEPKSTTIIKNFDYINNNHVNDYLYIEL